jgi:NAD(P)-dependent dehydrogenase (short-subunit alcohol dehydrogenase family)
MSRDAPAHIEERFDARTVVVTGVGHAGQVGEVVAREFARRGASVAIIDRDLALAEDRAAALRSEAFDVRAYACDLTDADATADVARRIAKGSRDRIYGLANIAGGFAMSGPIGDSDPAVLQRQLSINLGSAYGATRAFLPFLRSDRGAIVFMAAAAVLPGAKVAGMSAYVAAKAGVVALMRCVAQEERGNGVRANALAPTAIRTTTNLGTMGDKFPYVERESIAAMIVFLCSEAAANVNGQVIELA